jgi:hypothetical protein
MTAMAMKAKSAYGRHFDIDHLQKNRQRVQNSGKIFILLL